LLRSTFLRVLDGVSSFLVCGFRVFLFVEFMDSCSLVVIQVLISCALMLDCVEKHT
jgi:hypothetical protein